MNSVPTQTLFLEAQTLAGTPGTASLGNAGELTGIELNEPRSRDIEGEKRLFDSELDKVREDFAEYSRSEDKRREIRGGIQSLLETKERLMRNEFERKFQELAVQVKRQRIQHTEQVDKLKKQLQDCICNGPGWNK